MRIISFNPHNSFERTAVMSLRSKLRYRGFNLDRNTDGLVAKPVVLNCCSTRPRWQMWNTLQVLVQGLHPLWSPVQALILLFLFSPLHFVRTTQKRWKSCLYVCFTLCTLPSLRSEELSSLPYSAGTYHRAQATTESLNFSGSCTAFC